MCLCVCVFAWRWVLYTVCYSIIEHTPYTCSSISLFRFASNTFYRSHSTHTHTHPCSPAVIVRSYISEIHKYVWALCMCTYVDVWCAHKLVAQTDTRTHTAGARFACTTKICPFDGVFVCMCCCWRWIWNYIILCRIYKYMCITGLVVAWSRTQTRTHTHMHTADTYTRVACV